MGWPLRPQAKYREFGGSFIYPMGDDMVSIGMVVGLDYRDVTLSAHDLLQELKTHPKIRPILEGGERLEWGAKTIPGGGFHALPQAVPRAGRAAVRRRRRDGQHPDAEGHALRDRVGPARRRGRVRRGARRRRRRVGARARDRTTTRCGRASSGATCTRCATCATCSGAGSLVGAPLAGLMTLSKGKVQRRQRWRASATRSSRCCAPIACVEVSRAPTASSRSTSCRRCSRRATRPATTSLITSCCEQRVARDVAELWVNMCPAQVYAIGDRRRRRSRHRRARAVELRAVRRHHRQGRPPHPTRRRLRPRVHR